MKLVQLLSVVTIATLTSFGPAGCGGGEGPKTAKVVPGPMPENETWTGVYFHPVYGHLHLMEEGSNVVGRWKRTDHSRWGEMSGTKQGNVFHYTWKEHTVGMIGPSATVHGKGYFVYTMNKEGIGELHGEFGLKESEVGSDWKNVKQQRMQPDLKSIGGESEGVPPSHF
jgi:hypothetical protein